MQANSPSILLISIEKILPPHFEQELKEHGFKTLSINDLVKCQYEIDYLVKSENLKCIIFATKYINAKTSDQIISIRKYTDNIIPLIAIFEKSDIASYEELLNNLIDDIFFYPFKMEVLITRIKLRLDFIERITEQYIDVIKRYRNGLKLITNHEFNTPMTAIVGFSELLKISVSDLKRSEILEYTNYIVNGASRLMDLMRRIRIWQDLEKRVFVSEDHNVMISEKMIYSVVQVYAKKYKRESDVLYNDNNFYLYVDKAAIELIISELVDNAFKFSRPETKVLINLLHKGVIIESVSDVSFATNEISEFYQYDRVKYEQQGVGLGLAIVKLCCTAIRARLSIVLSDNLFRVKILFND